MTASRFSTDVDASVCSALAAAADAGLAGLVITPGYDLRYPSAHGPRPSNGSTALVLPASDGPPLSCHGWNWPR